MKHARASRIGWLVAAATACAPGETPFPLRAPLWQDSDLRSVSVPCRPDPTSREPAHVSCTPRVYRSAPYWDETDNILFRPLSEVLALDVGSEAADVNSLDEVPDSSWFTNRIGARPMSLDELALGGCEPSQRLADAGDGAWTIDKGKSGGKSPGFRARVPGKGEYLFKADDPRQPEQASAASAIGAAAYHAVGFNTTCEQVVYLDPSRLTLAPGLVTKTDLGDSIPLDRKAVGAILSACPRRGTLARMSASAWLAGRVLGPFRYSGTREDDPNDVVPHEDRRELRGGRLLAAWLGHVDAREQGSVDVWLADRPAWPDSSPGHVWHSYLDWGDCLGSRYSTEEITRRVGHTYIVDWGDVASDFVTLGIPARPWDTAKPVRGHEIFGYFGLAGFDPERWKNEYPNPAFSRMTERDAAWMARILARFTRQRIDALVRLGDFTDPKDAAYLAGVLEGRLERIAERYLTRLSPIADVRVEGVRILCGTDLAEWRGLRPAGTFRYAARWSRGGELPVTRGAGGSVCVALPRVPALGAAPDDAPARYVRVAITDGIARGPLVASLYDLGPARGYRLAGLERPDP